MNDSDTTPTPRRGQLLNYETVKYFNNEAHETRRFDRSMGGSRALGAGADFIIRPQHGQAAIMALAQAS